MWQGLLAWMEEAGRAGDSLDPRWSDETVRLAERERLFALLEDFTRSFTPRRVLPRGAAAPAALGAGRPAGGGADEPAARRPRLFVEVRLTGRSRATSASRSVPRATARHGSRAAARRARDPGGPLVTPAPSLPRVRPRPGPPGRDAGARPHLVLAGPYATRSSPTTGPRSSRWSRATDPTPRASRPRPPLAGPVPAPDTSGYFNNFNRNKRSVALNLLSRGARALRALCG
jgi:crotonobetainyl-CoA:carnitine CoA-transferase CaiB-like acyl-CoA transferase